MYCFASTTRFGFVWRSCDQATIDKYLAFDPIYDHFWICHFLNTKLNYMLCCTFLSCFHVEFKFVSIYLTLRAWKWLNDSLTSKNDLSMVLKNSILLRVISFTTALSCYIYIVESSKEHSTFILVSTTLHWSILFFLLECLFWILRLKFCMLLCHEE